MLLDGLKAALTETGFNFVFAAWRRPPDDGDYGVYFLDGQAALNTGAGAASEKMLTGYIDYYTKDPSETPKNTIETALHGTGCYWQLESVQFEDETGYIHYEWSFTDTTGALNTAPVTQETPESVA